MTLTITAIYTLALLPILIALGTAVTTLRAKHKISLMHADNHQLAVRIRRHANFIENVPFALLLLLLAEVRGGAHLWLHIAGALLVVGRILHPLGLEWERPATPLRIIGGSFTNIAMLICAISILLSLF